MSKRFTDTEKWKDEWFLSLNNDSRIVWLYMLDNCSLAGILKKNFRMMNFCCSTNFTETDILTIFQGRIEDKGQHYFISKFISFQYPRGLTSNKPIIKAVRKELSENHLLNSIIDQSLTNDSSMNKVMVIGIGNGNGSISSVKKPKLLRPMPTSVKKPTMEEVVAYCKEKAPSVDGEYYFNSRESNGWLMADGKPILSWKHHILTWERINKKKESNVKQKKFLN